MHGIGPSNFPDEICMMCSECAAPPQGVELAHGNNLCHHSALNLHAIK